MRAQRRMPADSYYAHAAVHSLIGPMLTLTEPMAQVKLIPR
jgi:hypothetical protein